MQYILNLTCYSSPDWLKTTINTPEVIDALRKGEKGEDCSIYKCSLPLEAISKLVALGRSMFS